MNSSDIISSLKHAQELIDEWKTVCICNPITLKNIKEKIDISGDIVFIEDARVEQYQVIVVKDPEFKKILLEMHYRNELEKNARLKSAKQQEGE